MRPRPDRRLTDAWHSINACASALPAPAAPMRCWRSWPDRSLTLRGCACVRPCQAPKASKAPKTTDAAQMKAPGGKGKGKGDKKGKGCKGGKNGKGKQGCEDSAENKMSGSGSGDVAAFMERESSGTCRAVPRSGGVVACTWLGRARLQCPSSLRGAMCQRDV